MTQHYSIETGLRPGLLGDVAALHGRIYARDWQFPLSFEAGVAREMGAFLMRFDSARDHQISVVGEGRIFGAISLDASDPALPFRVGHLRWFIMSDQLRGQGLGKRLLGEVITCAWSRGLDRLVLTTFKDLEPAASLYRRAGFKLVGEAEGETWGRALTEQRWELTI